MRFPGERKVSGSRKRQRRVAGLLQTALALLPSKQIPASSVAFAIAGNPTWDQRFVALGVTFRPFVSPIDDVAPENNSEIYEHFAVGTQTLNKPFWPDSSADGLTAVVARK